MTVPPRPPVQIVESAGRRALWDYFPSRTNDCPGYMWMFDRQHIYEPCGIAKVNHEIKKLHERF
jgi:hypothetical protein